MLFFINPPEELDEIFQLLRPLVDHQIESIKKEKKYTENEIHRLSLIIEKRFYEIVTSYGDDQPQMESMDLFVKFLARKTYLETFSTQTVSNPYDQTAELVQHSKYLDTLYKSYKTRMEVVKKNADFALVDEQMFRMWKRNYDNPLYMESGDNFRPNAQPPFYKK